MLRLLARHAPAALLAALAACHAGSSGAASADDGGADACAPCSVIDSMGGTVSIPCGQNGCLHGLDYLCSRSGNAIPTVCGLLDAAPSLDGGCVPQCGGGQCEISDQCGGVCGCPAGVVCSAGRCGGGCNQAVGAYCTTGPDSGSFCCAAGAVCGQREAGAPVCCVTTGGPTCIQDNDCCDYPNVHCLVATAGPDAAVVHECR